MKFAFGKPYSIVGLSGVWRVTEIEYLKKQPDFITCIKFSRDKDGRRKTAKNLTEAELGLVVKEIKENAVS